MAKLSKDHLRTSCLPLRVSAVEKNLIRRRAKSEKVTVAAFIRAMALNQPPGGRAVFYKMLDEQTRFNAELQQAPDFPAKERIFLTAENFMLWVMSQK